MKVSFPVFIASLVAAALPSAHAEPPYQGVFTMSNEDQNVIGVNRIKDDGGLEWVGAFETGGIGLGFSTIGRWTSTNIVNYHVWNNQQWLVAANMGGPNYESSVSIFKVAADLTLELTDVVDAIRSETSVAWATSVAAYDDRACVFGGGDGLILECFRISAEGKLSSDFYKDFDIVIDPDVTIIGDSGPTTVQFSPDGKKLAVLSKGSVTSSFYSFAGEEFFPDIIAQGGLYIFPVIESGVGYGEPTELEYDAYLRPYDLVWHPDSELLWTVGFPETPTGPANIRALQVESDLSISEIGFFEYGPSNACWIEYLNGYLYTSNFIMFNDLTTFAVAADGTVDVASPRTTALPGPLNDGNPTLSGPFDFSIAGASLSGKRYMYVELALSAQIAALQIAEDGSLTELGRYIYGDSDDSVAWPQNAGMTTTLLSQQELNEMFRVEEPPYQGVFTMSNELQNEVGVYRTLDNGGLQWVGNYETGGTGFPFDPVSGRGWTSANCISYHVWNKQQWVAVVNMGGPDFKSSVSIFKVAADLTLQRTDVVDAVRSDTSKAWANSVTSYGDRVCVYGAGDNLLLECFRISTEGKLSSEFFKDFDIELDPLITVSGAVGTASVQFSPDGTKLAVLSKGSVSGFYFEFGGAALNPDVLADAGLYIFPVLESGDVRYGEPMVLEIDAYSRPYDLVWSPASSDRIWTVGFPVTPANPANIMTIDIDSSGVSEVGIAQFGPSFACWIEYLNGYLYTSNFVLADDVTIFSVKDDGVADITSPRTQPMGNPPDADGNPVFSGPFDFGFSGETGSGKRYMYVQLALSLEIGAYEVLDDGSMKEVGRYPIIGDWTWNSGTTTTLLSRDELDELFSTPATLPTDPTPSPTPVSTPVPNVDVTDAPSSPPSGVSGTSQTIFAFTSAFAAVVVPFLLN